MRTERLLTAIANTIILCLALALIGVALYATWSSPPSACLIMYQTPLMGIGAVLFIGALVGLLALVCENGCLVCMQLTVSFAGMWALLAFAIFALVVTGPGGSSLEKSRGFTVFEPAQFSAWMQQQVASNSSWAPLASCLYGARTCGDVRSYLGRNLKKQQLSPLEAGCCLPPQGCVLGGLNMSAPVYYSFAFDLPTMPKVSLPAAGATPSVQHSSNCSGFSAEPSELCFGCPYCQGGLLTVLRDNLRMEAFVSLGVFAAVFMLLLVACFAYCGARPDDDEEGGKGKKTEINLARQETFVIADQPVGAQLLSVPTFKRTLTMGDGGPAFTRTNTMADSSAGTAVSNAQLSRTLTRIEQALGADLQAFKRTNTMAQGGDGEQRDFSRTRTFQYAEGEGDGGRGKTWSRTDSSVRDADWAKGRLLGRVDTLESSRGGSRGPEHGKFRSSTFKRGEGDSTEAHSRKVGSGRGRHRDYDEESARDSDDMSEDKDYYDEDDDAEDDVDLYD
ncbi:hypothetical protein CLOM_g23585 [Closterium sp. NIES-68]|nr:hypothetical protein CLOM_g23585 [Closterium sp. NIES-68]